MDIIESSHPQATVLALNGRLDGHASPIVTERIDSVVARGVMPALCLHPV